MKIRTSSNFAQSAICIECRTTIHGTLYAFGGSFACEQCVRNYYKHSSRKEVEIELLQRASEAHRMMRSHKIKCNNCGRQFPPNRFEKHQEDCEL